MCVDKRALHPRVHTYSIGIYIGGWVMREKVIVRQKAFVCDFGMCAL